MQQADSSAPDITQLLRSIAEQLKLPLTTIARQADLGLLTGKPTPADMQSIGIHATTALQLVDSYLLGLHLSQEQTLLTLEPVSVSSMLTEAAHELSALAKQYEVDIQLHIAGKYAPVMAHRSALKSALLSLGSTMLEYGPAQGGSTLTLAVHRTPQGVVTGVYGDYQTLSTAGWRKALTLQGKAAQPLRTFGGNGAGLFVADAILQAMATRLRVGKYLKKQGFATTLQQSQQLSIV